MSADRASCLGPCAVVRPRGAWASVRRRRQSSGVRERFLVASRGFVNDTSAPSMPTFDPVDLAWRELIQLFLSQEAGWAALGRSMGVSPPLIRLLMMVRTNPTVLMRDLAVDLGVGKSYVTALVKQLVSSGHLSVGRSATDGRVKVLELTDEGRRVCDILGEALFRPPAEVRGLRPDAQAHLVALAAALRAHSRS